MMMKNVLWLLLLLLAALAPRPGSAAVVGEAAPPLVVSNWIKGGPVVIQPGTNIFVVEIWRSTSAACRACITNLNRLHERFKTNGVVLIGVSDEPVDHLKDFVLHGPGASVEYAVAADDHRKTTLGYMNLVNLHAVPFAFVVGTNGNVLWYGSPMGGLDAALHLIVAGNYDSDRFEKIQTAGRQMQQYLTLARRGDRRTTDAGELMLANRTNDPSLLCEMAYQICTDPHLAKRDFALAAKALDQAEKLPVSATNPAPVMIMRAVWLFASGKPDAGLTLATQALGQAQSPVAKSDIKRFIGTMQAQLAMAKTKTSQTTANTNHPSATTPPSPAQKPAAAAGTNQP
jgi:hypothetical protein